MGLQAGSLRVLLTEDEALIGLDLSDILEEAGYEVIGPATTVAESLRLLEQRSPQLAVIDVLLRDGSCSDLAEALRRRAVPFLVHSGSLQETDGRSAFRDAPWLTKPVARDEILDRLGELSDGVAAAA